MFADTNVFLDEIKEGKVAYRMGKKAMRFLIIRAGTIGGYI